jgi:hypothetical protein
VSAHVQARIKISNAKTVGSCLYSSVSIRLSQILKFELKMCKVRFDELFFFSFLKKKSFRRQRAGTRPKSTFSPEKSARPKISIHPGRPEAATRPPEIVGSHLIWAVAKPELKFQSHTFFCEKKTIFYYSEMTELYSRVIIYSTYVGTLKYHTTECPYNK